MKLTTQYGNIMKPIDQVALDRGKGMYNPPPIFQQTTNRGNSWMNALSSPIAYEDNNTNAGEVQNTNDSFNLLPYAVGSTGFHDEPPKSWDREEFEGAQNQYVAWALKALIPGGITPTPLLLFFFSTENVNYIQDRIKNEVKKIAGQDINNQSVDEILIIMRSTLIYAYSGWLPGGNKDNLTNRGEKPCSLEDQLSRLNKSVIQECVKQVLSGINQYKLYMKDKSSMPMPLSLPIYTSMAGSRELSESIGFNSGLENSISAQSFNQRYNII